jgi:cobaltochelatase CobT
VSDGPADEPYRIYTRAFDLTVDAAEVPLRLAEASPDGRKGWLHRGGAAWDAACSTAAGWAAERREADAVLGHEMLERWAVGAAGLPQRDIVLCLLIDQSGSMKGEPMAAVAAASDWLARLVDRFGAKLEILGFSTAGWKGGHAYQQWLRSGAPKRPGRLCALMHVVYKKTDEPALAAEARRVMLHPDLLRENVDGEALRWAAGRLGGRPESHKLLVVISDGAPVDDATLLHNGLHYLPQDLAATVERLGLDGKITLGGLELGSRAVAYPLSRRAAGPDDLTRALGELVEAMLARASAGPAEERP